MTTSKARIAAVAVLASAGGIIWQHQINTRLREELVVLRRETEAMSLLRAENTRLLQAQADAEVVQARLQAELARLRDEAGVERVPHEAPVAVPHPVLADTSTPRSAAQTVHAAIDGGDPDTLVNVITIASEGMLVAKEVFDQLPPTTRERYGTPERMVAELLCATTPPSANERMLREEELPGGGEIDHALAEDPSYRTLHTVTQDANGRVTDRREVYQETDDGWRWVVSSAEVRKRLAETGLAPPSAASDPASVPPSD